MGVSPVSRHVSKQAHAVPRASWGPATHNKRPLSSHSACNQATTMQHYVALQVQQAVLKNEQRRVECVEGLTWGGACPQRPRGLRSGPPAAGPAPTTARGGKVGRWAKSGQRVEQRSTGCRSLSSCFGCAVGEWSRDGIRSWRRDERWEGCTGPPTTHPPTHPTQPPTVLHSPTPSHPIPPHPNTHPVLLGPRLQAVLS